MFASLGRSGTRHRKSARGVGPLPRVTKRFSENRRFEQTAPDDVPIPPAGLFLPPLTRPGLVVEEARAADCDGFTMGESSSCVTSSASRKGGVRL